MPKNNSIPRLAVLAYNELMQDKKNKFLRVIAEVYRNSSPKLLNPQLVKKPEETRQFAELFRYIKKNTAIPNFLANIQPKDKHVGQLLQAIHSGNLLDDIFSDSNCYLYLLYLLEHQHILYWHGITVYVYLIALMQFTNKQELHPNDKDIKDIRLLNLEMLTKDGKISEEGELYLKKSCLQRLILLYRMKS